MNCSSPVPHFHQPLVLPVQYAEHRFYVQPVSTDGITFNLFTDTGGGLFLYRDVAERLRLPIIRSEEDGANAVYVASLPHFKPEASIPLPQSRAGRMPVFSPSAQEQRSALFHFDGLLGQEWFAGRVWTFDYPRCQILLRATNDVPRHPAQHRIAAGFKTDVFGKRLLNFPRIQVTIDGDVFDLLFDTGATTFLSEAAVAVLKDGRAAERATSFITATIFEKWRKQHPNWRVIEQADQGAGEAMIEVPHVTIAGYTVGPVWFTRRADGNFHEFMSQFMDKRVEGALGGNALQFFHITVDYPNAFAVFVL